MMTEQMVVKRSTLYIVHLLMRQDDCLSLIKAVIIDC